MAIKNSEAVKRYTKRPIPGQERIFLAYEAFEEAKEWTLPGSGKGYASQP